MLGVLLEIIHNWTRVAVIYIASVVGGSLFITLLSPNNYAVGASAGMYGLLFSQLSTIILNWKEMDKRSIRLCMLLLYIIADICINFQLTPDDSDVRLQHKLINNSGGNEFHAFSSNRPITLDIWVVE